MLRRDLRSRFFESWQIDCLKRASSGWSLSKPREAAERRAKCSLSVTALIRPDTQFKHAARLIHIYCRRRLACARDGISNQSILQIILSERLRKKKKKLTFFFGRPFRIKKISWQILQMKKCFINHWELFHIYIRKRKRGGTFRNHLSVTFRPGQSNLFLPVEPVGTGSKLPIGVGGDTWRASPLWRAAMLCRLQSGAEKSV